MGTISYRVSGVWKSFLDATAPVFHIRHAGAWEVINSVRPLRGDYLRTTHDVSSHGPVQHGSMEAPVHLWNGTHWWPPENSVLSHGLTMPNGGWDFKWEVRPEFSDEEVIPAAAPWPAIHFSATKKNRSAWEHNASSPAQLMHGVVVSRVWLNTLKAWEYHVVFSKAAALALSTDLDTSKGLTIGVDGEDPYGPYSINYPNVVSVHAPVILAPGKPRIVSAVPATTSTKLTWPSVPGAVTYSVKRDGRVIATGLTSPTAVDHGLAPGSTHHYEVTATNAGGTSPPATTVAKNTVPSLVGLHAVPVSTSAIRVYWTPVPGATSYIVSIGGTHHTVTSPTYTWGGLHESTKYTFTVQAVGPGWKTPARTVPQTTKTHVPVAHTVGAVPSLFGAAYDENGHRRGTNTANPWQGELVQGRYGSIHGNTFSTYKFDTSKIPAGAHITSVKLTLTAKHWYSNSGGTVRIRNVKITGGSKSRAIHHPLTTGHVTTQKWTTKTGTKTFSLPYHMQEWRSGGDFNAIQIGPGRTTSQSEYGVFTGEGTHKPKLEIKYTI